MISRIRAGAELVSAFDRRKALTDEFQAIMETLTLLHAGIDRCDKRLVEIEAELSSIDDAIWQEREAARR